MVQFLVILILFSLNNISCRRDDDYSDDESRETVIVETTTREIYIHTDIPESEIKEALNLDFGNYTTMRFTYINSQFDNLTKADRCYDDFIKCLITQVAPTPVCAYNSFAEYEGFYTAKSYCDVHFDSCKRQVRFWRVLDYGSCRQLQERAKDIRWTGLGIPETLRKALLKYEHFPALPIPELPNRY